MGGRDPYSASKGCAELVTAAYRQSFFTDGAAVASVRAGNVIGGGDWAPDRIIPDSVRALVAGEPIVVRNPDAVRPWQHVLEPLSGYLRLGALMLRDGQRYEGAWNFGPTDQGGDRPVRWVVDRFLSEWGSGTWTTPSGTTAEPHEAHRLSLDSSKARERLGWAPVWDGQAAVGQTASWYREYYRAPARSPRAGRRSAPGVPGRRSRGGPALGRRGGRSRPGDGRRTTPPIPVARSSSWSARYYRERHAPRPFDPGRDPVRYAGRVFGDEEMRLLVDSSLDFYLTASRYTEQFEAGFADYLGLSNALFVNSGSSANLVALTALTSPQLGDRRLMPGDEVITVAAGFPSTVSPIIQNGLVPVFVDVRLGDYNADPDQLRAAISPRTRAIMLAHTLGRAIRPRHGHGPRQAARSVVRRGQLRRPGGDASRPAHRDVRPPGDLVLLSGPPHHDRRRRHGRTPATIDSAGSPSRFAIGVATATAPAARTTPAASGSASSSAACRTATTTSTSTATSATT